MLIRSHSKKPLILKLALYSVMLLLHILSTSYSIVSMSASCSLMMRLLAKFFLDSAHFMLSPRSMRNLRHFTKVDTSLEINLSLSGKLVNNYWLISDLMPLVLLRLGITATIHSAVQSAAQREISMRLF
jgi:hypothetical protein